MRESWFIFEKKMHQAETNLGMPLYFTPGSELVIGVRETENTMGTNE